MLIEFNTVNPWSREEECMSLAQSPFFSFELKNLEITIFWNVTPCSFEEKLQSLS
jgi:hypothetical protein